MYRARRLSGTVLAVTMFVALSVALSASAGAQEDQTMQVDLTPSRDSGVSGTATLEDAAYASACAVLGGGIIPRSTDDRLIALVKG